MVGLFLFGLFISRLDVYKEKSLSSIETMVQSIPPYFKRKVQLVTIIVDIVLITASFTLAHIIRFEAWSPGIEEAVIDVLPAVIVLKIVTLTAFGLYRSVWRYAGVSDLMRLFVSTCLGSVLAGAFAWVYATGGYLSASVFAIDWFVFLFLLASSRFAFKGLRRLLAIPTNGGKNVILYGAGDGGWLALSEIRQNEKLHWDPVGFIDDSPYKQKGKIQELQVLGTYHDLMKVCEAHEVEEVLICIRNLPEDKKEFVRTMCSEKGIGCRKFIPAFNELSSGKYSEESDFEFEYSE
jgi:UDP-GlcNAc:undecaprenyl-phosphate GlcNAc-1-phosphate transferase